MGSRKKDMLQYIVMKLNVEDRILSEANQANSAQVHLHEVFKIVKIIESENEIGGSKTWGKRDMGSYSQWE